MISFTVLIALVSTCSKDLQERRLNGIHISLRVERNEFWVRVPSLLMMISLHLLPDPEEPGKQ